MNKEQKFSDLLPDNYCEKVSGLSAKQIFIAFCKYESGCRPGDEMWSKEDQDVIDALHGESRPLFSKPM